MKISKKIGTGKIYFLYLFLVLFLQIIGYSTKGSMFDTLWKAGTIGICLLYIGMQNQHKIASYIVLPCALYFVGQIFALYIPFFEKSYGNLSSLINCFVVLVMSYFFLSVPYTSDNFEMDDIIWFLNAFIILMIYAVVYNFIQSPSAVLGVLSNSSVYSDMMSSFFDNKQTFGMFLFMALIATMWQYVFLKKTIYIFIAIIFGANLFICLSRTALFACLAFLLIITMLMWNANRNMSMILISVIIIVFLIIQGAPELKNFIDNVLMDTDSTIDARTNIWGDAFDVLKGGRSIVGYGEGNVAQALDNVSSRGSNSHNGIIQVLLTGGIVKCVLYICVLSKSISSIRRVRKYNKQLAYLFFATICSVLIYSMGEALVLLDTSAPCIIASIMCLAFPLRIEKILQTKGEISL